MTFTRTSDRWKLPATIAGFFILVVWAIAEFGLPMARRPSDAVTHVMLVLGAGLISPSFVADAIRAWRGISKPPPVEPPAPPRVSP